MGSSLPSRHTRVIGREVELETLRSRLFDTEGRLVTMTGTAGTGKTTLAIEVARALESELADGVALIDLRTVYEDDDLALVCCEALGLIADDRPPLVVLTRHLATRQLLLVLDNCEHLSTPAPLVDRLLDACPDLRILATSRAPLLVRGESVCIVAPMSVPDVAVEQDVEALGRVPSVDLFVEHATAARPGFRLVDWAPAVASICRRLDGLPLAIELAAAQTATMSPREIDQLLAAGSRLEADADGSGIQQHTMDATLDWSYDLLGEVEQVTFRRLAIFAGGWTLEAAEAVCSLGGDPSSIASALVTLVQASLVVRDGPDRGNRFRMLAPVADYAARRLVASGERDAVAHAHAQYVVALVSPPSADWRVVQPEHLDRIAEEYDDCLAALHFAEARGIAPLVLACDLSLLPFWRVRGLLRTGLSRLETAMTVVGAQPSFERALVLAGLAHFDQLLGGLDRAEERALEAAAVFTSLGDDVGRRTVLGFLGDIAADRGDTVAAQQHYERALELAVSSGSDLDHGLCRANLGRLAARSGDLVTAERELERARTHLSSGPGWYSAHVLAQLGSLARHRGDHARAETLLVEALDHLQAYGAVVEAIGCLDEVARLALDRHDGERAATLLAAATELRDATALATPEADRQANAERIERLRSALGPATFAAAWARGRGLSLDEAAAMVGSRSDARTSPPPPARTAVLTPRERQVAVLVAEGLSNAEIAARLAITHGTARIHVERILAKLGLSSRVQIATLVVREARALDDGGSGIER